MKHKMHLKGVIGSAAPLPACECGCTPASTCTTASTPVICGTLQINTTECIRAACVCALKTAQSASVRLGVS